MKFDLNKGFNCTPLWWVNSHDIKMGRKDIGGIELEINGLMKNYIHFSCFEINEKIRNKGYGKLFLTKLIEQLMENKLCDGITLHCLKNNLIAQKLYKSLGFKPMKNIGGYTNSSEHLKLKFKYE